jgi:uncharacterized membrane protein YhaH (DUF805 family)
MIRTLFADLSSGRLQRLPYLGWYAVLALFVLVIGFGIGASIGLAERASGGEAADAQMVITEHLGVVGLVLIIAIFSVLLFAHLNIAAKRIRDMGLPGWLVLLGAIIVGGLIGTLAGQGIGALFNLLGLLALFLIPSNAFGKSNVWLKEHE